MEFKESVQKKILFPIPEKLDDLLTILLECQANIPEEYRRDVLISIRSEYDITVGIDFIMELKYEM